MADAVSQTNCPDRMAAQELIATVVNSQPPEARSVVDALLCLEKTTKQHRIDYPLESLLGTWQLWFVTGTRKQKQGGIALGKGFYVPQFAPAQISFQRSSDGTIEIGNQVQLGALRLRFIGPARYLGKKNLLAFDFIQWQLLWGEQVVFSGSMRGGDTQRANFEQTAIAKLPFFAFFHATEQLIAARGRGGGLAIWRRPPSQSM